MLGRLVYPRLRRLLLPDFRRMWTRDVDERVLDFNEKLSRLQADVSMLRRRIAVKDWEDSRAALLPALERHLAIAPIDAHVRRAIADADLRVDPTPHVVVHDVLPTDFFDVLRDAIPPSELFPDRDPVKQDLEMSSLDGTPELTRTVWRFFDERVVRDILTPALLDRFQHALTRHYAESGGEAFGAGAAAIPHHAVAGRILLRRPGYHLRPHLDPKRVAITGLLYLARPGDSERYGTQLFRVNRPFVAPVMKTFFPEDAGMTCELAGTVPFRPNTLLAFVNSRAAHGATLPPDAPLQERYSFQFYIKPDDGRLKKLLADSPESVRRAWEGLSTPKAHVP